MQKQIPLEQTRDFQRQIYLAFIHKKKHPKTSWRVVIKKCAYCNGTGFDPNSIFHEKNCIICDGLGRNLV